MTKKETAQVMATMRAAYPGFYAKQTESDILATINLWASLFADEAYSVVQASVIALIKNRVQSYPPSPGEVNEQLQKLMKPDDLTENEAWAMVSKALRNGVYGFQEEFDKLPTEVKATVGRAEQLREWAMLEPGEVQTVVASNFMRSFKTKKTQVKQWEALPSSVKTFVSGLTAKMEMPAVETEEQMRDRKIQELRNL